MSQVEIVRPKIRDNSHCLDCCELLQTRAAPRGRKWCPHCGTEFAIANEVWGSLEQEQIDAVNFPHIDGPRHQDAQAAHKKRSKRSEKISVVKVALARRHGKLSCKICKKSITTTSYVVSIYNNDGTEHLHIGCARESGLDIENKLARTREKDAGTILEKEIGA